MTTRGSRTPILFAGVATVALVLAIVFLFWRSPRTTAARVEPPAAVDRKGTEAAETELSIGGDSSRRSIEAEPRDPTHEPAKYYVRGRVVDQSGEPVEARVFVGADEDPSAVKAAVEPERLSASGSGRDLLGQSHSTNAHGEFRAELRGPGDVLCVALPKPGQASIAFDESLPRKRWVSPPADDVVLVVRRVPYGTLSIRAIDALSRSAVDRFVVAFRIASGASGASRTENGELRQEIRVPGPAPTLVELQLRRPKTTRGEKREVAVSAGETVEVVFEVFADSLVKGQVVDEAGAGIAGASVYFGTRKDVTGDEPFKPVRMERVDAIETDPQGWFELSGVGSRITTWHPEHATTTVPAGEATRIVMRDRGRIQGWLPQASPAEQSGEVVLDRELRTLVGPSGEFHFENVDPGVRGMWLPGGAILSVLVEPGATTEVRLDGMLATVEIEFLSAGQRLATPLSGALAGAAKQGSVQEFTADEGVASLLGVLPGRYVAYFRSGAIAQLEIDRSHVQLELGAARLLVRTAPGRRLYLLPAGGEDDPFQRFLGARFARTVPASGELSFEPLLPIAYSILEERSETSSRVEVIGPETEIVLP